MLIAKKIIRFEPKVNSHSKTDLPMDADLLVQKLGKRWYAFWQLSGEIYFQISKELNMVARG